MSATANSIKYLAYARALEWCSKNQLLEQPKSRKKNKIADSDTKIKPKRNVWLALRKDKRDRIVNGDMRCFSQKLINAFNAEFHEITPIINSRVWEFLDRNALESKFESFIYSQTKFRQSEKAITELCNEIINENIALDGPELDNIAVLICCLHLLKNENNSNFIKASVLLARNLLMLNASDTLVFAAEGIWKYINNQYINEFKYEGLLLTFSDENWTFVSEYLSTYLFEIRSYAYVYPLSKRLPYNVLKALIEDFVFRFANIDPDQTEIALRHAKNTTERINIKAHHRRLNKLGVMKYIDNDK